MGQSVDRHARMRARFDDLEANVRSYCRDFPAVFVSAQGATLTDVDGRRYIDFLAGAGALNYGHNHPALKRSVLDYIAADGIISSLDLHTRAKHAFIDTFDEVVLKPRGLDYRLAFPGPTGTNAVEAALKFARLATGRQNIVAFTNGYHGMTQGALAASGTKTKRAGAGMLLAGVTRLPFDGYMGPGIDTSDLLARMLDDPGSGLDHPAAILLETLQAEGGLNVASQDWLRRIRKIADAHGIALIIDDIQAGCGRTGSFFSFEPAGIEPDIVCLSKSIGGLGTPMSLVLLRPDLDVLAPGQHNGTFRGNNLAFVAGAAALDLWRAPEFGSRISRTARRVAAHLDGLVASYPEHGAHVRGRGLLIGIGWTDTSIAERISGEAYKRGLIIETAGARGQVLKLIPPLLISDEELARGLEHLDGAFAAVLGRGRVALIAGDGEAVGHAAA